MLLPYPCVCCCQPKSMLPYVVLSGAEGKGQIL